MRRYVFPRWIVTGLANGVVHGSESNGAAEEHHQLPPVEVIPKTHRASQAEMMEFEGRYAHHTLGCTTLFMSSLPAQRRETFQG